MTACVCGGQVLDLKDGLAKKQRLLYKLRSAALPGGRDGTPPFPPSTHARTHTLSNIRKKFPPSSPSC